MPQTDHYLKVRIPKKLWNEINRLAEQDRRPLSNWVRIVFEDEVERHKGKEVNATEPSPTA